MRFERGREELSSPLDKGILQGGWLPLYPPRRCATAVAPRHRCKGKGRGLGKIEDQGFLQEACAGGRWSQAPAPPGGMRAPRAFSLVNSAVVSPFESIFHRFRELWRPI